MSVRFVVRAFACVLVAGIGTACDFGQGVVERSISGKAQTKQADAPPIGSGTGKVSVSWEASREKSVNSAGGGYRVYYSRTMAIDGSTPFVNVPWVSGDAPTSAEISGLSGGVYYVSVVAYSARNPAGSVATQTTVNLN